MSDNIRWSLGDRSADFGAAHDAVATAFLTASPKVCRAIRIETVPNPGGWRTQSAHSPTLKSAIARGFIRADGVSSGLGRGGQIGRI